MARRSKRKGTSSKAEGDQPKPDTYVVRLAKGSKKGLEGLPASKQNAVKKFIRDILRVSPLQRIPGKTKKLKGAYKGIIQYDIDDRYRIHYAVDNPERIVRILYIGPHPKW